MFHVRLPATSNSRPVRFGALDGVVQLLVVTSREGDGLSVLAELLPLDSITEAPFVVEALVEGALVVPITSSAFSFTLTPTDAPSLGDCWSETSPSAVLYHWHWKSFFHISAGSGSAPLVFESG